MDKKLRRFLLDPDSYPRPAEQVKQTQTHISWVFLAGNYAYKVKKPVDFGFLDFTTLAKRKHYCQEEVRLNKRLAPDIYLGVAPIGLAGGRYNWKGQGRIVEYAVRMKRMPQERMMDVLLERERKVRASSGRRAKKLVTRRQVSQIARLLADFHRRAATGSGIDRYGARPALKFNAEENFSQTEEFIGTLLPAARFGWIKRYSRDFLRRNRRLLQRRLDRGRIRHCHGDCYSKNVCLTEPIRIYDCIEFNKRFSCCDVASEIAFLAMDLDFFGRPELARQLVRTYVEKTGDRDLPKLLDYYKCYRAYVRAKIHAFSWRQAGAAGDKAREAESARRYFELAYSYAGGRKKPGLLVICGLTGSGKSRLARRIGRKFKLPVISSDRVRKELAGIRPTARKKAGFGRDIYSPRWSALTYEKMLAEAGKKIAAGETVILDATFNDRKYLRRAWELAGKHKAGFLAVECFCLEEALPARFSRRAADPEAVSDGRWEIYLRQKRAYAKIGGLPQGACLRLDTSLSDKQKAPVWNRIGRFISVAK